MEGTAKRMGVSAADKGIASNGVAAKGVADDSDSRGKTYIADEVVSVIGSSSRSAMWSCFTARVQNWRVPPNQRTEAMTS